MVDYIDLKKRQAKLAQEREGRIESARQILARAAVEMERLTGHESWDEYLRCLQPYLEAEESELKSITRLLVENSSLTDEEVLRYRRKAIDCQAAIRAYRIAMNLPAEVMRKAGRT